MKEKKIKPFILPQIDVKYIIVKQWVVFQKRTKGNTPMKSKDGLHGSSVNP